MSESLPSGGDGGESGNELWAPFSSEILTRIVSRLNGTDLAALRSTCNSWRTVFSTVHHPNPLPFLLLPPNYVLPYQPCFSNRTPPHPPPPPDRAIRPIVPFPRLDHGHTDSPFFPFDSLRNPAFRPLPALSDTAQHICVGSSHGWLILLGPTSHISLVNPFTAATILLPTPLSSVCLFFLIYDDSTVHPRRSLGNLAAIIRIAALSADPTDDPSFLLVIVLGNAESCCFYTCGPSDHYATWKAHPQMRFPAYGVTDLIFHNGLCFAAVMRRYADAPYTELVVGPVNLIFVLDFHVNPAHHWLCNILIEEIHPSKSYVNNFIESAGELLLICRLISRHGETTVGRILVYRLPPLDGEDPLVPTPLASIGDRALFLGMGNTVAVHAPDFPLSVRRNSIYFTDVYLKVVNNQIIFVGCVYVFDMEQGVTTKAFEVVETDEVNMWMYLRPWWVTPNLHTSDP